MPVWSMIDDRHRAAHRPPAGPRRPSTTLRFLISTVPLKFDSIDRRIGHLRRAADVERPHRQLRARLTDRLRGDDADRLADVDRRAAGEVAPVALRADTR